MKAIAYTIFVLTLLCGLTVVAYTIALVPTDEIAGYVIKVDEQTDVTAISAIVGHSRTVRDR